MVLSSVPVDKFVVGINAGAGWHSIDYDLKGVLLLSNLL